jgi:hypothetical protein
MKNFLLAAVLVGSLAACGDDKPEPIFDRTVSPSCSDVWVVGQTLPKDYEGCMDGDSLVVSISDSTGAVVYDDRLKAEPGHTIEEVN